MVVKEVDDKITQFTTLYRAQCTWGFSFWRTRAATMESGFRVMALYVAGSLVAEGAYRGVMEV